MIQQPAFRMDEIQIASECSEHEREAILAILQQASDECKLISRACAMAVKRQLPLPKSPEALMSFMLFETREQEGLARMFHETMTNHEKPLDLQATSCLAEIWEYIANLRKFVNLLYELRVKPAQIAWEYVIADQQEGATGHTYSFGLLLKGVIGTTHAHYAEAYYQAVEAMEPLIQRVEKEADAIEGVSYAMIVDWRITPE